MTLIVGILCENGVVMAADSEATMGSAGAGLTAAQRTAHKLTIHHDKVIFGFSGFLGLEQRLTPTLEQTCRGCFDNAPDKVMAKLFEVLVPIVKPLYEMSQTVAQATRNNDIVGYAVPNVLVALPVQHKARLLRIYENCSTEYSTEDLPFVAIGSGQKYAEPFLAFLRSTFWPTSGALPSVADAEFSAYWTLQHVIDTHALGGIGGEIQLATLTKIGSDWKAVLRTEAEHAVHKDAIDRVVGLNRDWRSQFGTAPTSAPPEAPPV